MGDFMHYLGDQVERLGAILDSYYLLFIIVFGVWLTVYSLLQHNKINKGNAKDFIGFVLNQFASFMSLASSIVLLVPIVARALWAIKGQKHIAPDCIGTVATLSDAAKQCSEEINVHMISITQNSIPFSSLLGGVIFIYFLASLIWFVIAVKSKPSSVA